MSFPNVEHAVGVRSNVLVDVEHDCSLPRDLGVGGHDLLLDFDAGDQWKLNFIGNETVQHFTRSARVCSVSIADV